MVATMKPNSTITDLLKNYKLTTADKAQVCDGQNWETFRDTRKDDRSEPEEIAKSSDAEEMIATSLSYRPARKKSMSNQAETEKPPNRNEERKEPTSSFLPTISDDDNEPDFLDLSEPSEPSQKSEQDSLEKRAPEVSEQKRRASRSSRRTSAGDVADTRRASTGDVADRTGRAGPKVALRKLSEPMHRCSTTNKSVSGIMRPARYSSNNLAAMSSSTNSRFSSINLSGLNEECSTNKVSPMLSSKLGAGMMKVTSCMNFASVMNRRPSDEDTTVTLTTNWVAHGVEFSKNMEVYVFKK